MIHPCKVIQTKHIYNVWQTCNYEFIRWQIFYFVYFKQAKIHSWGLLRHFPLDQNKVECNHHTREISFSDIININGAHVLKKPQFSTVVNRKKTCQPMILCPLYRILSKSLTRHQHWHSPTTYLSSFLRQTKHSGFPGLLTAKHKHQI